MKKSISKEIAYHLAKAQNSLACDDSQQVIQREINYAKALIEKFVNPGWKADEKDIEETLERVDLYSKTLHVLD